MALTFNHEWQQYPEEFDWLADRLLAAGVRTLVTIGVFHGGTEWHMARRFQAAGMPLHITAVDPYVSPGHPDVLHMVAEECPLVTLEFRYVKSSKMDLLPADAYFIDGDHTALGVCDDYELASLSDAKIIAIHDIVPMPHTEGVARFWAEHVEVFPGHVEEIRSHPDGGMGIGIFYRERAIHEERASYGRRADGSS